MIASIIAALIVLNALEGYIIWRLRIELENQETQHQPILPVFTEPEFYEPDESQLERLGAHSQEYHDLRAAGFEYVRRK